jgi:hypothetical protein
MADSLVSEVIGVDSKKYSLDPNFTEEVGREITELIAHYKFDRMSCGARNQLPQGRNIDMEISKLITNMPERLRHAELHRQIAPTWESTDSQSLSIAITQIDRSIEKLSAMNVDRENRSSILFSISDQARRADFDINTTIARLYDLKATLLLADSLLLEGRLTKKVERQVRQSLAQSYVAFRRGSEIWWHGYGNFLVTAALLAYAQKRFDIFTRRLTSAANLLYRTNDLSRRDTVQRILEARRNSVFLHLDRKQLGALLFGE